RIYGIMAAGRPVLVSADAESDTARLVAEIGCGIVVPPGQPDLTARVIREVHDGAHDLEEMGWRGREYVLHEASRATAVRRGRDAAVRRSRDRIGGPGGARTTAS